MANENDVSLDLCLTEWSNTFWELDPISKAGLGKVFGVAEPVGNSDHAAIDVLLPRTRTTRLEKKLKALRLSYGFVFDENSFDYVAIEVVGSWVDICEIEATAYALGCKRIPNYDRNSAPRGSRRLFIPKS